jgi:hypothetical protein
MPWITEKELACLQIYETGFPETDSRDETTRKSDKKDNIIDNMQPHAGKS